jgi:GT2 family glycosyltransferase
MDNAQASRLPPDRMDPQASTSPPADAVAVCICTRDRPAELAQCLAAVAGSTVSVAEVVVSDDGDGADDVCRQAPLPVTHVRGPRTGLAANRNNALRHVSAPYVVFLDDDCLLGADFLATALPVLHAAEDAHGQGGVIVSGSESNGGRVVVAHEQTFLGFQARPYRPAEAMHSIVINATVFPSELFDRLTFDEQLRYGYEEVDLASRAVVAGWVIAPCPEARNDHRPSAASRADYERFVTASRLYATFKRYLWTERRRLRATAFAVVAPLHVLAAAARTRDPRRVLMGARSLRLAAGYVATYRAARGDTAPRG